MCASRKQINKDEYELSKLCSVHANNIIWPNSFTEYAKQLSESSSFSKSGKKFEISERIIYISYKKLIYIYIYIFKYVALINLSLQVFGAQIKSDNQGQYHQVQPWQAVAPETSYQYYGGTSNNTAPSSSTQQNQFNQGYVPLPNNIKIEEHGNNAIFSSGNAQFPNTPVYSSNAITTHSNSSNIAYEQWRLKFSAKDSNGFHCLVCQGKSFTADSSLQRHYKQNHEQMCKACKMEFYEEPLLAQHIRENHEFHCNICTKVFTTNRSLKRHYDQQHCGSSSRSIQNIAPNNSQVKHANVEINKVSSASCSFN